MRGETHIWFLSAFFFVPLLYADTQFECGAHGRFEYCVDGIPGCVVGCHCHPGYYFDTDSKICEHNSKLTRGSFRRYYNPEPTRVATQDKEIMTPPTKRITESTTVNAIEEQIDEITKDADDLGDWLYNQFFKTIENQVINKTQGEGSSPNRRSGDILLKPSRRSHHRPRRHRQKKRRSKSRSLKSKLLRITEDDSLFESNSGSSSNSDESSASSSDSGGGGGAISKEKKDDSHGHKKILIFNKKPQPPLPSFIFLPNMDSPFYPPIGLPPPPMPMYPMVPVPPMLPGPQMGPPMFPFPGPPLSCGDETSTAGGGSDSSTAGQSTTTEQASTTSEASTKTAEPTTAATTAEDTTTTTTKPDDTTQEAETEPSPDKPVLRSRLNKKKTKIVTEKKKTPRPVMRDRRNKLLKRLRDKMNRKNKLENYYMGEQSQDPNVLPETPDTESESKNSYMSPYMQDMLSQTPDVDFKYLADLIHKADINRTMKQHAPSLQIHNKIPDISPPLPPIEPIPSRRNNYQANILNNFPRHNFRRYTPRTQVNDSFYTDLGKQIASMIRKIDSIGDREVNIEIEEENRPMIQNPVFNGDHYASRSFWERSVRSPLKHFASFRNEMENLKKSNEDLFSIESKVEVAASTARILSLHDLENIISHVQKTRTETKRKFMKSDNSNTSFKLDLLPNNIQINYDVQTSNNIPRTDAKPSNNIKKRTWSKQPLERFVVNRKSNKDFTYTGIIPERKNINNQNYLPSNLQQELTPNYNSPVMNRNDINSRSHYVSNIKSQDVVVTPTRKPNGQPRPIPGYSARRMYVVPHAPVLKGIELNRNNKNHYSFHKNPYLFDNPTPILDYSGAGFPTSLLPNGKRERPSYFHHEFHHFDYFDK